MKLITLDFETFYSSTFSLSKMSTLEYILGSEYETIGVGIAVDDGEPVWYTGKQVEPALRAIDWQNAMLLCQNTNFDGAILSYRYGITPAFYADTMAMAQASGLAFLAKGASLAAMTKFLTAHGANVPNKGTEIENALGKHLKDFSPQQLAAYGEYCKDDVRITRFIFQTLLKYINEDELAWQDMVISMYTQPQFNLNKQTCLDELARVHERRDAVKQDVMQQLGVTDDVTFVSTIMSNPKFAQALKAMGAEPPVKISKTTGKETFAFAKTDEGMLALTEHADERVCALAEARLGLKSSIEVTRCEKFIKLAEYGFIPVPYRVSGTITHRLGGSEYNLQNLPSGRKVGQSKALRRAIEAPPGMSVVVADSSQIEVRVLAYVANQPELIQLFAEGGDPYSDLAATLYHADPKEIARLAKDENNKEYLWRQTGKVGVLSLGYGAGKKSTQTIAKVQYNVHLSDEEVSHLVDVYRTKNYAVPAMWQTVETALEHMIAGGSGSILGPDGNLIGYDGNRHVCGELLPGFLLPDGMWISLPNLRHGTREFDGRSKSVIEYDDVKGRKVTPSSIWGGSATGLLVQATAFALMKWQGKQMRSMGYRPALNSHDEFATVVPDADTEAAETAMKKAMSMLPSWISGTLPVKASTGIAKTYGDAK